MAVVPTSLPLTGPPQLDLSAPTVNTPSASQCQLLRLAGGPQLPARAVPSGAATEGASPVVSCNSKKQDTVSINST